MFSINDYQHVNALTGAALCSFCLCIGSYVRGHIQPLTSQILSYFVGFVVFDNCVEPKLLRLAALPGASPEQPWYRRPGWPLHNIYIVSRQSLYLLDPPSAHKPSSEKPGLELPTACLRGRRLNHRLGGPVGGSVEPTSGQQFQACCQQEYTLQLG